MKLVLDADVLIGALDGSDAHHRKARALFVRWNEQETTRLLSVVNFSEVLIALAADDRLLRLARKAIRVLGVGIHLPGAAIGVHAARLSARHPISLPDAYCLATASYVDGAVASFDRKVRRAARAEQIALAAADD